jgi:hypothetical protein
MFRTLVVISLLSTPTLAQDFVQMDPIAWEPINIDEIACEVFLTYLNNEGFMRPDVEVYFRGLSEGLSAGHPRLMTEFRVACSEDRRMLLPDALAAAQASVLAN